ncbi:hypothetical protein NLU13_6988 [Sarocladium strictum]|uniref:Zn(2)-C6 fungal-type domain-containing protein n=1 Tax=Sarocladium strictum TaxID=5046 RepID=A0AA39GEZ9_SARSR|nr:hypothetical protein NLU13_6988 [Sarocladium strictum]
MVYCGKASLGCQSCRKRRIKCDKIRPDCTQCVRIGKKCPGYRDQLSLMFRDESTKVMQKARAQWGEEEAGTSTASQTLEPRQTTIARRPSSNAASRASPASATSSVQFLQVAPTIAANIGPSLDEQGTSFYINRYVIGHPDEPRTAEDLVDVPWIWSPILNDAMVALGLAGLSNLRGDTELMTTARGRYGQALRQAGALLISNAAPSHEAMRLIVMLALFELVKGAFQSDGVSATTHVLGGTAMIKSWLPTPDSVLSTPKVAFSGVRSLLQMAYTMFIPAYVSGTHVPTSLHDILNFCSGFGKTIDAPALNLGRLMTHFVEISAFVRNHILSDGRPAATTTLKKMLDLDDKLHEWTQSLPKLWLYSIAHEEGLPRDAVFEGEWHRYHDIWVARIWAHYRWTRTLLQEMILNLIDSCPTSSLPLVSAGERQDRFDLVRQLSRDTLASTPTFWRHPLLSALGDKQPMSVDQFGGGGSGAAGIPVLVFQLQVAGCAPGVPLSHWEWAAGILECIFGDMGMIHAKSMREAMIHHREKMQRFTTDSILTPIGQL